MNKFALFCVNIQIWKIWDNGDITGEYGQLYNVATNESNLLLFPERVIQMAKKVAYDNWGIDFDENQISTRIPHREIKKGEPIYR